jgi:hypothetical protein
MKIVADLLFLALGVLPLVGAIAVRIAGIQRLRGRRARGLDGVVDVASAAFARSIYPPSLRGGGRRCPSPEADRSCAAAGDRAR